MINCHLHFFDPVTQQKINDHCKPLVFRFVLPLNMGKGYAPTLSIFKRTASMLFEEKKKVAVGRISLKIHEARDVHTLGAIYVPAVGLFRGRHADKNACTYRCSS